MRTLDSIVLAAREIEKIARTDVVDICVGGFALNTLFRILLWIRLANP
jgi:hypothetical protein